MGNKDTRIAGIDEKAGKQGYIPFILFINPAPTYKKIHTPSKKGQQQKK